jgi:hypothetical protein
VDDESNPYVAPKAPPEKPSKIDRWNNVVDWATNLIFAAVAMLVVLGLVLWALIQWWPVAPALPL